MSDILEAANRFKLALLRGNDKALAEMSRTYIKAWKRLAPQFERITRMIAEAELAGEPVSPNWIMRQKRYRELMISCEEEIMRYTRYAAAMVGDQQRFALSRGIKDSKRLMQLSLGLEPSDMERMRVRVTWNQVPEEAIKNIVGFLSDGSPISYKFAGLAPEVSQGIKDTLSSGITMGWNPRKIASEIERVYKGALGNTLLTCRTETMRAYRTASMENYRANSDVVSGWVWMSAKQPNTCAACWAMDGTFHMLDEELVDHPGGRCVAVPVTKPYSELFPGAKLIGVRETKTKPWDPTPEFEKLSERDKRQVLGWSRYKLYKDGKLSLRDLAVKERSRSWGDHYRPKTVKEINEELGND